MRLTEDIMTGIAIRRHHRKRMLAHARHVVGTWGSFARRNPPEDLIRLMAATHCRPCSCWMCSHDKKSGCLSIRDQRAAAKPAELAADAN